jgi:TM2 domain-containing membrane protein YozV
MGPVTYPYHEVPQVPAPQPPAPASYLTQVSYSTAVTYPAPVNYPVSPYAPMPVMRPPRSAGAAVALELVPGLFGVFGVGTIYAGRTGAGVALMVSFWLLFWINVMLCLVFVGFITLPLTWLAYFIAGSLTAARSVEKHNAGR